MYIKGYEMKELYATGEWIFVWKNTEGVWVARKPFEHALEDEWKLIHKKHTEVLNHVLSGGEVEVEVGFCSHEPIEDFFRQYEPTNTYEIIPKKQTCTSYTGTGRTDGLVMCNTCNELVEVLEHFHTEDKLTITPKNQGNGSKWSEPSKKHNLPKKPPKRITREEAHLEIDLIQNGNRGDFRRGEKHKYLDDIFDYIEYLEANQNEK